MNFEKNFYYMENGICKKKKKIIKLVMKTGLSDSDQDEFEINLIRQKLIKSGIYTSEQVHEPETFSTLYFEKRIMCELLSNNKIFRSVCFPKLFLKEIDNYIKISDYILHTISEYIPKSKDKEIILVEKIESYRKDYHFSLYKYFLDILTDYREFLYKINFDIYYDMLYIWENLFDLREELLYGNISIIEAASKYAKFLNEIKELDKPITYYSRLYDLNVVFGQNIFNNRNITEFILCVDREVENTILELSTIV